jgi:hypothetical protein
VAAERQSDLVHHSTEALSAHHHRISAMAKNTLTLQDVLHKEDNIKLQEEF